MILYLDIYFIINYLFDFISLFSVNIILKRNTKLYKIILGSLLGSISLLTLFIRFNKIELLFFKIILSILMIIITFNYKDIKYFFNNLYYFYIIEIILGGFIYLIKNNYNTNLVLILLLSFIFIYLFIKRIKDLKNNYNKYLSIKLDINNKTYTFNAFLDTGNKLIDPIFKYPIILINNNELEGNILVPYKTINNESILRCLKGDNLYINNKKINKKFLVGISNNINIDGVDCIFNERLMEGI